jgi:hypothetical protein
MHKKSCKPVSRGLIVQPLADKLKQRAHLWGAIQYRQAPKGEHLSPHRESLDIHLRYNPIENESSNSFHTAPHVPQWYPVTKELNEVIPAVAAVLASVCADMLGSVFLINIPKGKQIYPHVDKSWNSTYFQKYCVSVQNINQRGVCSFEDGSSFAPAQGDCWRFENDVVHWFDNTKGEDDAIMLIVNCRPMIAGILSDVFGQEVRHAA